MRTENTRSQLLPLCKYLSRFLFLHIWSRSSLAYHANFWFSAWPSQRPWGRCVLISIDLEQENTEQIGAGPRLSQTQELTWNTLQNTFTFYIAGSSLTSRALQQCNNVQVEILIWVICSHILKLQYVTITITELGDFRVLVSILSCPPQSFVSHILSITLGHSADPGSLTWILLTIFLL